MRCTCHRHGDWTLCAVHAQQAENSVSRAEGTKPDHTPPPADLTAAFLDGARYAESDDDE